MQNLKLVQLRMNYIPATIPLPNTQIGLDTMQVNVLHRGRKSLSMSTLRLLRGKMVLILL